MSGRPPIPATAATITNGSNSSATGGRRWSDRVEGLISPPKHPKAALQEWAAANNRRTPDYAVVDRSGPDHALRFTVSVSVRGLGEATGTGSSKAEAEKAAAEAMLETL